MDNQPTTPEQAPELMNPDEIEKVIVISDDQCEPCLIIQDHIRQLEEKGGYPGTIELLDPTSEEAERFFEGDQIGIPSALIVKKDGTEQACEVFMNEETLALRCEGKLLILHDVPQELRDAVAATQVESQDQAPAEVSAPVGEIPPTPVSHPAVAAPLDDLPSPP